MGDQDMKAELERLKAENAALKQRGLASIKSSESGETAQRQRAAQRVNVIDSRALFPPPRPGLIAGPFSCPHAIPKQGKRSVVNR